MFVSRNIYAWAYHLDDNGTIWIVRLFSKIIESNYPQGNRENGIEAFFYGSISNYGVPLYSSSNFLFWPNPPQMLDPQRVFYDPETDIMYISGLSANVPYVRISTCVYNI